MEHAPPPLWPNVNVPPGYRFKPTPRELIQCYLEPWVATEPGHESSPGEFYGIMAAADVYGEDPGTLASRFQHIAHDDGNWYFLSIARWKDGNPSSKRFTRAVGGGDLGTWHGSGKKIAVRGAGCRQTFEFRPADGGKAVWLMEEFTTVRTDATGQDGVRVLCRLHLTPKAALAAAADGDDRQQQLEANDVPAAPCNIKRQRQHAPALHGDDRQQQLEANDVPAAPCNIKRQRQHAPALHGDDCQQQLEANDVPAAPCNIKRQPQHAPARQVERHLEFDADYWTAAPDVGFSSSYATTTTSAAPPPPDVVGCSSYATASPHAAAAAPVTELTAEAALATWQHQPIMEQAGDENYQYHCAGVSGGVYNKAGDGPQPLEMVAEDVVFAPQDFKMDDYMFTVEHLLWMDG